MSAHNLVLNIPIFWTDSHIPNPSKQPLSLFSDINGKMDLEKLVETFWIPTKLPKTFALLWAKPLENFYFRPQTQGGKI